MMGRRHLPLVTIFGVTILFFLAFLPVWTQLIGVWVTSDEYSHGFLILPVSIFLVWRQREALSRLEVRPSRWGLPAILFSLAAYLLSFLAGVSTTASLSMVLFFGGVVLHLFGWAILRRLLFPIIFLLFMIPVPAQVYASMTVPLQLLVSRISVWLSALSGVPLYQEGNLIHLPQRTLQVVDACSGLRSMMMLLALSALVWHLTLKSKILGSILLVSAIPVALMINVLRVTVVVVSLWHLNFDLSGGILHTILGLSVNFLALLMIFSLRGALQRWDPASPKG